MSRVDRITIEVGPTVGSEVSPFDGVRDVAADIPATSGALPPGGGRGMSSVAAHIRSSEPALDGQVTSPGWGNCGSGDTWLLNFPLCSFKKLLQPSERFLKTLSVANVFEVERLLEYLAFVLKIRRLARVWDS
jgi:hypothetical protein